MEKNQNDNRNQQNEGTSRGTAEKDLGRTPGKSNQTDDKKRWESENEESDNRRNNVKAAGKQETDKRSNDNRGNTERDNQKQEKEATNKNHRS